MEWNPVVEKQACLDVMSVSHYSNADPLLDVHADIQYLEKVRAHWVNDSQPNVRQLEFSHLTIL
jgi:hypothetical protein